MFETVMYAVIAVFLATLAVLTGSLWFVIFGLSSTILMKMFAHEA